ncbi:replication initiator [Actinoallomurus rhizosphaericola]|uniref:replication initiator n=1 Tax=Actinoallomurus rhizosphaericola TaxID=2952536 RepID=UPI0027E268E0|nr:replication initiator [Actinoallomurus rhizosphaericola]
MRRTDLVTGETAIVNMPCGHTLASVCPPCAERKRKLRATQCREGWHLEAEPVIERADPDDEQRFWMEKRAEVQAWAERAEAAGEDSSEWRELLTEINAELAQTGVVGRLPTDKPERPKRSTKRRQDVPDLPRRPVAARTVGKVYTAPDGKTFRPSLFLTLTLDSYGRVKNDGTPVDPATYDYARAARDALHFSKLVDRFVQNLRRFVGYDVQYFATVEPQRRLAPHLHMAIRGTISRAELRQVVAATYTQVWWPSTDRVVYAGERLPYWDARERAYLDPDTHLPLTTWQEALRTLDDDDAEPLHVGRFGCQIDAQGVMAGTPESSRLIGYLTKYLVKDIAECHAAETPAQADHADRLLEALRYEPCSPTCANWLRYGIQPKNARHGLTPGYCKAKAHRREYLGYAGRRVLVSRKWSGKTLTDHKADRKNWVLARLAEAGVSATGHPTQPGRYAWELAPPDDPDVKPVEQRLLASIAERVEMRRQLDQAKTTLDLSATQEAA